MSGINNQFISDISNLEKRFNISEIQFNDYNIWPYFRLHLFDLYVSQHTKKPSQKVRFQYKLLYKYIVNFIYSFLGLLFSVFSRKKIIVLSSEERLKVYNNKVYERVAGDYLNKAKFIINPDFKLKQQAKITQGYSYSTIYITVGIICNLIFKNKKINGGNVINNIANELGLTLNFAAIKNAFFIKYYSAKFLLKVHKPTKVVVINAPSFYPLIIACKEANILVEEIQHGVINQYHPGYNFQTDLGSNPCCFPDEFLSWGKYFDNKLSSSYFYHVVNIVKHHYFFLSLIKLGARNRKHLHNNLNGNKKTILLTGQEETEELISSLALDLARLNKFNVVYCPRFFNQDAELNLKRNGVIYDKEVDFYSILPYADLHITVFSTTLLESISIGVKTIMYAALPNADDYFKHLVDDKSLFRYSESGEILKNINELIERPSIINPIINTESATIKR